MPLFRVAVRDKNASCAAPTPPPSPTSGSHPPAPAGEGRGGGLAALMAGGLVGLLAIAAVSYYVVRNRGAAPPAAQPAATAVGTADASAPAATQADVAFTDLRTGPSELNGDYQLEDGIAEVSGQVLAMRDLDRAVRVARVLGDLAHEPVPENGDPALKAYQVKMLKRLIDLELMRQGAELAGLLIPGGTTDDAVEGYLDQVGATRAQLDAAMAARGVTPAELDDWFRLARTSNFFIAQNILTGTATDDRDALVAGWLARQWELQPIVINFYDPDEVTGTPDGT